MIGTMQGKVPVSWFTWDGLQWTETSPWCAKVVFFPSVVYNGFGFRLGFKCGLFCLQKVTKNQRKGRPQKNKPNYMPVCHSPEKAKNLRKGTPPPPPRGGVPFWQFSFALAFFSRWSQPENRFWDKVNIHQWSVHFQAFHLSFARRLDEVEACLLDMLNNRVAKRKESIWYGVQKNQMEL